MCRDARQPVWLSETNPNHLSSPLKAVEGSPGSSHDGTGFSNPGRNTPQENGQYDNNTSNSSGETFKINGGADRTYSITARYTVVFTYADGTTSGPVRAQIVQDTSGRSYLMPAERLDTTAHDATLRAAFNAADTQGRIVGVRIINTAENNQYSLVADRDPTTITMFHGGEDD